MMSGLALAKKPTLTDDQKMGSCLNVTVSLEGVTSLAKMPHCLSAGELMLNDCRANATRGVSGRVRANVCWKLAVVMAADL